MKKYFIQINQIPNSIKHCQMYITLLRPQPEDGSIRGAERGCYKLFNLIIFLIVIT